MGHLASVDQCGRHYFHLHMQFNRIFSGNWVLTHRTRWLTQYRRHFYWFAEMAPLVSWRRTGRKAPSEPVVAYFVGERHASLSLRIVNGYTMRLTTTSTSIPQCNYILLDDIILQTGVLLKPVFFLLIKEWEYIHDKVQLRADQSHYDDVTMSATASKITSPTIVHSTVYPSADQSKHQSSAPLALARGIRRGPVNSPRKWPATRKRLPFDDVIMQINWPIR